MARTGKVASDTTQTVGWPHATVVGYMDSLFAAGLLPKGTRGRGQKDGLFQNTHLASLALGFGGPLPADAAEATTLARSLIYLGTNPATFDQEPYAGSGNLGEVVEKMIDGGARRLINPNAPSALDLPFIELCFNPLVVHLIWENIGRIDTYGPDARIPFDINTSSRLRRTGTTITTTRRIHPGLIFTMGELWLDTLKVQNPELFAADRDQPENETAALPGATALRNQTHHTTVPAADTSELTAGRESAQVESHDRSGPFPPFGKEQNQCVLMT